MQLINNLLCLNFLIKPEPSKMSLLLTMPKNVLDLDWRIKARYIFWSFSTLYRSVEISYRTFLYTLSNGYKVHRNSDNTNLWLLCNATIKNLIFYYNWRLILIFFIQLAPFLKERCLTYGVIKCQITYKCFSKYISFFMSRKKCDQKWGIKFRIITSVLNGG